MLEKLFSPYCLITVTFAVLRSSDSLNYQDDIYCNKKELSWRDAMLDCYDAGGLPVPVSELDSQWRPRDTFVRVWTANHTTKITLSVFPNADERWRLKKCRYLNIQDGATVRSVTFDYCNITRNYICCNTQGTCTVQTGTWEKAITQCPGEVHVNRNLLQQTQLQTFWSFQVIYEPDIDEMVIREGKQNLFGCGVRVQQSEASVLQYEPCSYGTLPSLCRFKGPINHTESFTKCFQEPDSVATSKPTSAKFTSHSPLFTVLNNLSSHSTSHHRVSDLPSTSPTTVGNQITKNVRTSQSADNDSGIGIKVGVPVGGIVVVAVVVVVFVYVIRQRHSKRRKDALDTYNEVNLNNIVGSGQPRGHSNASYGEIGLKNKSDTSTVYDETYVSAFVGVAADNATYHVGGENSYLNSYDYLDTRKLAVQREKRSTDNDYEYAHTQKSNLDRTNETIRGANFGPNKTEYDKHCYSYSTTTSCQATVNPNLNPDNDYDSTVPKGSKGFTDNVYNTHTEDTYNHTDSKFTSNLGADKMYDRLKK